MTLGRKLVTTAGVMSISLGLLSVHDAWPAVAASVAQPGSITCTGLSGTIEFSPPLLKDGTSSEVASVMLTLRACTTSGGGKKPSTGNATASVTNISNNCEHFVLGFTDQETLAIKWAPSKKILPSEISFPGYEPTTSGGNFGFKIGGSGTTVSGSYAGSDKGAGSTAEFISDKTKTQIASCGSELEVVKFTSGTLTLQ